MKDKIINFLKWFFRSYIWVAILVFVFDISTKWIVQNIANANNIPEEGLIATIIPNFFNIIITHNLGAAFSLGANGDLI